MFFSSKNNFEKGKFSKKNHFCSRHSSLRNWLLWQFSSVRWVRCKEGSLFVSYTQIHQQQEHLHHQQQQEQHHQQQHEHNNQQQYQSLPECVLLQVNRFCNWSFTSNHRSQPDQCKVDSFCISILNFLQQIQNNLQFLETNKTRFLDLYTGQASTLLCYISWFFLVLK